MKRSFQILGLICLCLIVLTACGTKQKRASSDHLSKAPAKSAHSDKSIQTPSPKAQSNEDMKKPLSSSATNATSLTNAQWEQKLAKTNFMGPSDGPYPTIHKGESIWIDANVSKERIYIKSGNKTIYTMLTSSGLDTNSNTSTPTGTYYIQAEKGPSFYSPSEKEGANYWTSWKNHGEFLFHTIPTDKNGNYIKSEAEKLGQKASHGCFRLPVLDAKWIYQNIPEGTKVVIHT